MDKKFAPLAITPKSGNTFGREFRATIIRDANADLPSSSPQSLAQNNLNPVASAPSSSNAHPGIGHGQPEVILQRDGNRITGIVVKCSCGQVIEMECIY